MRQIPAVLNIKKQQEQKQLNGYLLHFIICPRWEHRIQRKSRQDEKHATQAVFNIKSRLRIATYLRKK